MEKKFKKDIEMEEIREGLGINERIKEIQLEVKISPTVIMYMGKTKLGTIAFDDLNNMGKFLRRLSKSIKQIIEGLKDEEKRAEGRGVKCRS